MIRRCLLTIALLALVAPLCGCSFSADFAIVNKLDQPVLVHYVIKEYPGEFAPRDWPSSIAESELSRKGNVWTKLAPERVQLDPHSRTVTVTINAHEALRVATMHDYLGHEDQRFASAFPIVEIVVVVPGGGLNLIGDQARRSFAQMSRNLYTLSIY
jgi:hypothetical protein